MSSTMLISALPDPNCLQTGPCLTLYFKPFMERTTAKHAVTKQFIKKYRENAYYGDFVFETLDRHWTHSTGGDRSTHTKNIYLIQTISTTPEPSKQTTNSTILLVRHTGSVCCMLYSTFQELWPQVMLCCLAWYMPILTTPFWVISLATGQ